MIKFTHLSFLVPVYNFIQRLQNVYIYMLIGTKFVIVMRLHIMPAHERQALNLVISRGKATFRKGTLTSYRTNGERTPKCPRPNSDFFRGALRPEKGAWSEAMALVALDEYKPWHVLQNSIMRNNICSHVFQTLVIISKRCPAERCESARVVLRCHMQLKSWHLLHPIAIGTRLWIQCDILQFQNNVL